eukprot:jgi/Chlat1/3717/Chrsp258S03872
MNSLPASTVNSQCCMNAVVDAGNRAASSQGQSCQGRPHRAAKGFPRPPFLSRSDAARHQLRALYHVGVQPLGASADQAGWMLGGPYRGNALTIPTLFPVVTEHPFEHGRVEWHVVAVRHK